MKVSIYHRHHFHSDIIKRAVWLYYLFNLSFRDIEELMIERGVDVSYETIRRWIGKFGSQYAKRIKSALGKTLDVGFSGATGPKAAIGGVTLWTAIIGADLYC